jgi:hypothetical protein
MGTASDQPHNYHKWRFTMTNIQQFEITVQEIHEVVGKNPLEPRKLSNEEYDRLWKEKFEILMTERVERILGKNVKHIMLKSLLVALSISIPLVAATSLFSAHPTTNFTNIMVSFIVSLLTLFGITFTIWVERTRSRLNEDFKQKLEHESLRHELSNYTDRHLRAYRERYDTYFSTSPTLKSLLQEIESYNQIIKELLQRIHQAEHERPGQPIDTNDKEKLLQAFKVVRTDLLYALQIERKVRENPYFRLDLFCVNCTLLQEMQFNQAVQHCQSLIDEALQMGIRVQDTMKVFIKSRQTMEMSENL